MENNERQLIGYVLKSWEKGVVVSERTFPPTTKGSRVVVNYRGTPVEFMVAGGRVEFVDPDLPLGNTERQHLLELAAQATPATADARRDELMHGRKPATAGR